MLRITLPQQIAVQPIFDAELTTAQNYIWDNRDSFRSDNHFFDSVSGKPNSGKSLSSFGNSNHGWGIAIDFPLSDPGSEGDGAGYALLDQTKWLESHASAYGYKPLLSSVDLGNGPGLIIDINNNWVNNYSETWHWNYKP